MPDELPRIYVERNEGKADLQVLEKRFSRQLKANGEDKLFYRENRAGGFQDDNLGV